MSSVEQRARDRLADAYDLRGWKDEANALRSGMPMDSPTVASLDTIAAALREQPEASYKLAAEYVATLLQRAARRIMSKSPRVADDLLGYRTILLLGLTAEQQPEARGAVEVAELAVLAKKWERMAVTSVLTEGERAMLRNRTHELTALIAAQQPAPPSAPVEDAVAYLDNWLRSAHGLDIGRVAVGEALERALTRQPAQAAPGDGRHRYEQSGEHGGCSVCGYPSHERLLHTPPGDDAAGGA